jgi:MHS family proline/betaine transporter-like MFS transporter
MGVFGVLYRKNLHESPHFVPAKEKEHTLKKLITNHPYQLLAGIFIGGFVTAPFATIISFINPVLMTKGFMSAHQLMWLQSFLITLGMIALIVFGLFADKFSPPKLMRLGAIFLAILSYPLLLLIDLNSFLWLIVASSIMIIVNNIILGPSNAYLKNIFPSEFRYRGSSLSFTIGMSLLGGSTPLIENALYRATGRFSSVAIWLVFIGVGSYWSFTKGSSDAQKVLRVVTSKGGDAYVN